MARIEVDVPLFKRCCFCIPLRYGLFALGSLKLFILLTVFTIDFKDFTSSPLPWAYVLAVSFNILLMAAAIMQKERLYQIYYKCAIVEIVIIVLMTVVMELITLKTGTPITGDFSDQSVKEEEEDLDKQIWFSVVLFNVLMLCIFFLQGYIILLVRSALIKLREDAASTNNTVELVSQSPIGKSDEV